MNSDNASDIVGHMAEVREFLASGREHLAASDPNQPSEKAWGTAAHMTTVIAVLFVGGLLGVAELPDPLPSIVAIGTWIFIPAAAFVAVKGL